MADWLTALIIYVLVFLPSFAFVLHHGVVHDQRAELLYFNILRQEKQFLLRGNAMESCVFSTAVPYLLSTLHIPPRIAFHSVPCLFHAAIPAFTYLTARVFFDVDQALLCTAFIVGNTFFLRSPGMGRVSIGVGLLSIMVWALLTNRMYVALLAAAAMPFAYYGITYHAMAIFGVVWLVSMFLLPEGFFGRLSVLLVGLLGSTWLFHCFKAKSIGNTCTAIAKAALINDLPQARLAQCWEPVVQTAFGRGFKALPLLRKAEWLTSWAVLGTLAIGMYLATSRLTYDYLILLIVTSLVMVASVTNKVLATYYGVSRAYFCSLPVFALCFGFTSALGWVVIATHMIVILVSSLVYPLPRRVEDNWERHTAIDWSRCLKED